MDEGINTFSTARVARSVLRRRSTAKRYFGGFVPWVFADLAADAARSTATTSPAIAATRASRHASRRRAGATGPAPAARSPTTRPRCGCTRSSGCSGGRRCRRSCRPTSRATQFKHPQPADFFAVANEVSGRDLTLFFDQVYRSSRVVRLRDRRRSRASRSRDRGYFGDGSRLAYSTDRASPADHYRTTVVVRRLGDGDASRSTCASCSRTARTRAGTGTGASAGRCSRSIGRCAP